ncbi:MAG TPA: multidrug effflux MFS transporter [Gammaproteobacteria bacterium]
MLIALLVLATMLGPLAMSSFIPAIPAIQQGFGVPTTTAQLTLTVSVLSMALSSLIYGTLADRYGRRPVLLGGVALAIAGSVICAVAGSVWLVIVGRALQAAGAIAGLVLSRVIVRDVYGDERSASVLAYVTAAMAVAPMLGPLAGGYLIDYFGWRSVFVAVAVLASLLLGLLLVRLRETHPGPGGTSGRLLPGREYAALLGRFAFLRYAIYGAAMQGTFMAFIAGAPYVATQVFALSASAYGWHFIVCPIGYLTGSVIAGRFGGRFEREPLLHAGGLLTVVICAVALWLALRPGFTPMQFFVPVGVLSCVIGIVFPSAQVGVLVSGGELSGSASGLFSFIQLALGAALAQLVGALLEHGPAAVTAVMAAVAVVGFGVLLLRPKPAALPLPSAESGG